MNNEQFRKFFADSKLTKVAMAKILGVSRLTVHNYNNDGVIPPTKHAILKTLAEKSPDELNKLSKLNSTLSPDEVIRFVLSNFDYLMEDENFRDKIYIESYRLIQKIGKEDSDSKKIE
jgi:DNA-binding XRE family transcriptional regulator